MRKLMKQKEPKSTLLADNILGLITAKQTKLRPVATAAPHPITPAYGGVNGKIYENKKKTLLPLPKPPTFC